MMARPARSQRDWIPRSTGWAGLMKTVGVRPILCGRSSRMHGDFTTCMEMSGNGAATHGMGKRTDSVGHWFRIRRLPVDLVLNASCVVAPGVTGPITAVRPSGPGVILAGPGTPSGSACRQVGSLGRRGCRAWSVLPRGSPDSVEVLGLDLSAEMRPSPSPWDGAVSA